MKMFCKQQTKVSKPEPPWTLSKPSNMNNLWFSALMTSSMQSFTTKMYNSVFGFYKFNKFNLCKLVHGYLKNHALCCSPISLWKGCCVCFSIFILSSSSTTFLEEITTFAVVSSKFQSANRSKLGQISGNLESMSKGWLRNMVHLCSNILHCKSILHIHMNYC